MKKPEVSVIVPARNAADTLGSCLMALASQSVDRARYEVIVVDDGSSDETPQIAEASADRLVRQTPQGPAAARNAGAAIAKGGLLIFTDADCVPAPDFLEHLSEVFRNRTIVAAKGVYRTRNLRLVPRFTQQEYQHKYDRMARRARIDFIDTYAAAYRREVFLENGGFDTNYTTASVEDQELSFRLARKGYEMVFVPSAVVYHRHDRSLAEYLHRKFGIGYWKALLLQSHPERLTSDTHTPFAQRLQLVLTPLVLLTLALTPFFGWAVWGAAALGGLFAISAVPELASIARRDPKVLVIVPAMLPLRALALGAGLAAGTLRVGSAQTAHPPLRLHQRLIKRALDILIASAGLILASPVLALAAVAVKLDSPGPALFIQERVGQDGRHFHMFKLRSMERNAEARLESVLVQSALERPAFKIPNDPRVTRVGRWLRRWSIDELPQLWNVLRGDMSLVGPRPEETRVVAQYSDWHRQRLAVPPGLTGPMQVNGRGELGLDARVRLELEYIEHYSIWRDLQILVRSVPAVISGQGAL